jgi:DNA replication ATP-dependent helicase Dna2
MDVSLFKRLSEANPHAVISLTTQYRMCEDVMAVCNAIIYDNRLRCASPEIARSRLALPRGLQFLQNGLNKGSDSWIPQAIDPDRRVVFLDTDNIFDLDLSLTISSGNGLVNGIESVSQSDLKNMAEVQIVRALMTALHICGFKLSDVGVVSPYKAQVAAISSCLTEMLQQSQSSGDGRADALDVNTIDKFQGRDKEAMIVSLVKNKNDSNVSHRTLLELCCLVVSNIVCVSQMGDLLRDWRRVNVAVTRAKKKLIIIGSMSSLCLIPILDELRKLVIER